jgi:pimeloyl-ACP methyl ester carboxylesterase
VVCRSPGWLRLVRMSPAWSMCAFAMPAGTSMLDALGGQPREWWIFAEVGESIMPDYPGPLLYGECTPAMANGAIARLRPRSVREPLRAAGYGEKPATCVISERDAILPVNVAERVAALAQATTISLDSGHHPMLSRPAGLALILAGIVARTALAEPAAC